MRINEIGELLRSKNAALQEYLRALDTALNQTRGVATSSAAVL